MHCRRALSSAQQRHGGTSTGQDVPVWAGAALQSALPVQPVCKAGTVSEILRAAFLHVNRVCAAADGSWLRLACFLMSARMCLRQPVTVLPVLLLGAIPHSC